MIENVLPLNEREAVDLFYSKPFKFSYSSLNKLLYSPQSFYNWYILKEREDSLESYLIEGKVIHCLLLDKEMFNEYFSILPGNIPTATSKKVVEAMYAKWKDTGKPNMSFTDYRNDILDWLVLDNTYQNLKDDKDLSKDGAKTGDDKRLEKVLTPQCTEYFTYLKLSGNKDVIDQDIYDRCTEVVEIIKKNKVVTDLLCLDSAFELQETHNELSLEISELDDYGFGLKGIIDNLNINHIDKIITINDIKTTSKSLTDFQDSLEYYKYWIQASIYYMLVQYNFKDLVSKGYSIAFYFIVIDKYNQVYPFPVSQKSLLDWQQRVNEEVLPAAKYHYTKKDYTLPYLFALDQVVL